MKRIISLIVFVLLFCSFSLLVCAYGGNVTYSGNAGNFVFEPGSDYSITDLFPDFKDVMPGDSITQKITVKNNADQKVAVKIYIRSLGAHKESAEFLSKLDLTVAVCDQNEMPYMFEAKANETAQLTDWVCLGTLYSGGEVDLDVTLKVPVELDNEFMNSVGYFDWEFKVEEFPSKPDDPKPPQTGDNAYIIFWSSLAIITVIALIILLYRKKKEEKHA
ncbi:MAG: LPXTG cell wall anchor domain-containing protein [Clostridia bacterium]|nr:LPXTG cell wall anchor domain-containing protein [Clostridia bacterium]